MSKKRNIHPRHRHSTPPAGKKWFYLNIGLAVVLILAGVGSLLWLGQQTPANPARGATLPSNGRPAPDFTLSSPTGQPISLSDYKGQVILVNMWATWCPPCKAEMPAINAFYQAHRQDGFVVLAVNSQEDAATVQQFIQAKGFTFPVALDTRGEVANLYQVRGLPTSFVIDRNGFIHYIHTGEISPEQLAAVIEPLL